MPITSYSSNQALTEISQDKQADAKTVLESQPRRSFATSPLPSVTLRHWLCKARANRRIQPQPRVLPTWISRIAHVTSQQSKERKCSYDLTSHPNNAESRTGRRRAQMQLRSNHQLSWRPSSRGGPGQKTMYPSHNTKCHHVILQK